MLSDFELREFRNQKKRQDALNSVSGRIAINAPKRRNEQEIAEMLKPWTEGVKPPEVMTKENDPVKEMLQRGGYID